MTGSDGIGDAAGALQDEAIAWVVLLTSGEATRDDAARLKAWRARSYAHELAFRRASAVWRGVGAVPAPARLSRRLFLAGTGAGAALAAGWAGTMIGVLPSLDQLLSDHATAVGAQARIDLPDGSHVDLDGASALDARFTTEARAVTLVAGAAEFEIAADPRPFRATIGPADVTATKARFAASVGAQQTVIDCIEGRIEVRCGDATTLQAGERARLAGGARLAGRETVAPDAAAPWRRGLLVFADQPLADVVADINRHRRGRIVLARPGLGERRVDGVFHLGRPDEIVTNLAAALKLRDTWLPGGVVLLS
ncbi:FecR family protein [Ancylobacter sp. SL191]|uniref:FecR family protein n=1 Tax=Ancylobacter sp. SL191 TaxID=2995166 RepID=UPI00226F5158|nr:FecR domain-containing protein [Ancylobacter sp. SL191]WAC26640.1 FecR domain-containing protein [Ancylobacter sp. SL191]